MTLSLSRLLPDQIQFFRQNYDAFDDKQQKIADVDASVLDVQIVCVVEDPHDYPLQQMNERILQYLGRGDACVLVQGLGRGISVQKCECIQFANYPNTLEIIGSDGSGWSDKNKYAQFRNLSLDCAKKEAIFWESSEAFIHQDADRLNLLMDFGRIRAEEGDLVLSCSAFQAESAFFRRHAGQLDQKRKTMIEAQEKLGQFNKRESCANGADQTIVESNNRLLGVIARVRLQFKTVFVFWDAPYLTQDKSFYEKMRAMNLTYITLAPKMNLSLARDERRLAANNEWPHKSITIKEDGASLQSLNIRFPAPFIACLNACFETYAIEGGRSKTSLLFEPDSMAGQSSRTIIVPAGVRYYFPEIDPQTYADYVDSKLMRFNSKEGVLEASLKVLNQILLFRGCSIKTMDYVEELQEVYDSNRLQLLLFFISSVDCAIEVDFTSIHTDAKYLFLQMQRRRLTIFEVSPGSRIVFTDILLAEIEEAMESEMLLNYCAPEETSVLLHGKYLVEDGACLSLRAISPLKIILSSFRGKQHL